MTAQDRASGKWVRRLPSKAMSYAEERSLCWLRAGGRPCTKWNSVSFIPSSCARWFISTTKASSLPATCSASATAASLADWIVSAISSSRTVKVSPCFR